MNRELTTLTRHVVRSAILAAAATAATCLLPSASWGQAGTADVGIPREFTENPSQVEIGVLYGTDDSFKFGDYTGIEDQQAYFLGNVDIWLRDAWDAESARYFRAQGQNLGLDSRRAHLEFGEQGTFGVFFDYDQLPKLQTDSARTVFLDPGGSVLMLPPGWVPSSSPAGMTLIESTLSDVDIDHERRKTSAGFNIVFPKNFEFKFRYDHETKDGSKLLGSVIGYSGGNPRSAILPVPIDYVTNQFDASLNYAGDNGQFRIGYYGSGFTDNEDSLTWQVPYTRHAQWDITAGYPEGLGSRSQPPDNWFHQVSVSGGYNLPRRTRATLDVA